jgi:GMP synthase (glutamine-hydrolysing)
VITDLERRELGTHEVELTEAGCRDPLFSETPRRFDAQFGHQDRVTRLPQGAVELARTALCPFQAFRIEGQPAWGCQFHVELNVEQLKERARFYQEGYLPTREELEQFDRSLKPSPWASQLLRRFFGLVVAGPES